MSLKKNQTTKLDPILTRLKTQELSKEESETLMKWSLRTIRNPKGVRMKLI